VTPIPADVQRRAAEEMAALPPGSALRSVVVPDWVRARDEARACARG
jgi:hypothetical protein